MHSEIAPHEKIRFRRSDIASLDALPSAMPLPRHARAVLLSRKLGKVILASMLAACVVVAVAVAIVIAGLGDERLRVEAQKTVSALAGEEFTVGIGGVRVLIDGFRGLALRIEDITIASREAAAGGSDATRVGAARFGLDLMSLMGGQLKIRSLGISDATIAVAVLARPEAGKRMDIFDADGLVDPDLVAGVIFGAVRDAADLLDRQGMRHVEVTNLELVLPGQAVGPVHIASASLHRRFGEGLRLSAQVEAMGRAIAVGGDAAFDRASRRVSALNLRVDAAAGDDVGNAVPDAVEGAILPVGAALLTLAGAQASDGHRLTLSGQIEGADLRVSRNDRIKADMSFTATAQGGAGKVEVERLNIVSGRSIWNFHGAFGPAPREALTPGSTASYRYELVSDGSTISPENSTEPTLQVAARIAGHVDATVKTIRADEIGVRWGQGEVTGRGAVSFENGKSPGLELRIDAGAMPVGHAKQLWPWFAAGSAQRWVTSNLFGGRLEGGWVELGVAPGRLGDGTPLRHEEVSGFFKVKGTRFDVAGRIPPVRDGSGDIAFFGTDVEIALSSGTVYMPSGRTVAAKNGVLDIRNAHIKPTIGKLDIEVAGEADAVLELASYDPINVGRFIALKPDDLEGEVSGSVIADIPLQSGIPLDQLGWKVELSYDKLSITQPFDGQMVRAARGTIVVDPQKAVIEAQAELNGMPATLGLTEPLGNSSHPRQRAIAVDTDDKMRATFAPGLASLLTGAARFELDGSEPGAARAIKANLQDASLSIPWIGWSKGPGIPASVSFKLKSAGERTELSDFMLRGETFAAEGTVSLRGDGIERVRFPSMRLHRGDDFSLDIARQGAGYAVTVRGRSLDARSVVKLYTMDGTGTAAAEAQTTPVPVTVDLKVAALNGFHGEALRDVTLKYSGTGSRSDLTEFSATTARGERVTFRDAMEGQARGVTMQSTDAGALLRFLDIYERMEGGQIALSLAGRGEGALRGQIDARNFWLVNEPRLSSIVSTPSAQDGRSLNQAVRGSLDTSRVQFERGFAEVVKGQGSLSLDRGILRGPLIGVSFQGTLNDGAGNVAMSGTFMPAYGLNRIFGEIPLIGQILGNGRDRGLIGITFRLSGRAAEPRLEINPLSVIAPGIFRSVFEFR